MKEELGGFIGELLNKLDKSIIILLLPIALAIYIGFFITDEELSKFFGITKEYRIKCPACGDTIILQLKDGTYTIHPDTTQTKR